MQYEDTYQGRRPGGLLSCVFCTFVLFSVCSYARFQLNSVSVASMTKGHG